MLMQNSLSILEPKSIWAKMDFIKNLNLGWVSWGGFPLNHYFFLLFSTQIKSISVHLLKDFQLRNSLKIKLQATFRAEKKDAKNQRSHISINHLLSIVTLRRIIILTKECTKDFKTGLADLAWQIFTNVKEVKWRVEIRRRFFRNSIFIQILCDNLWYFSENLLKKTN